MGRRLFTGLAAPGLVLVMAACGSSSSSTSGSSSASCPGNASPASSTTITITAADYCFNPSTLNLAAGKEVKITFINAGSKEHDLTIGSTDAGEADNGQTQTFTFTPTGSGTVQMFCKYHKDSNNMVGTVNLTGSAAPPASISASPSPAPKSSGNPYGY
ncbi:MAG: cupredoxin domain-containing protein [Candidatus Dormibacteraeota bacterium]|nr:cupredoxin domain-containing protein [Candidatus Dormibacteraeota bacterium]